MMGINATMLSFTFRWCIPYLIGNSSPFRETSLGVMDAANIARLVNSFTDNLNAPKISIVISC